MNRDALVARAETRFRDTANDTYSPTEWADYVNDAYLDVLTATPWWPFHEALSAPLVVAAQATGVALPADVWRVDAVYNLTDDYPLVPSQGRSEHLYSFPGPGETEFSIPTHYRIRNNRLLVYPNPARATTLHVEYREPVAILGATDEPVFPVQYHHMLVEGALGRAYMDDGNPGMSESHMSRFGMLLNQMMDDLLVTRSEAYHELVDTWGQ